MKVFVYGTLKRGFSNHKVMEGIKAEYLYDASLTSAWMYDMGPYPALVFDPENNSPRNYVMGELYEVNDNGISVLDWFEGVDSGLYKREKAYVVPNEDELDDEKIECWVYCWGKPIENKPLVKGGIWK